MKRLHLCTIMSLYFVSHWIYDALLCSSEIFERVLLKNLYSLWWFLPYLPLASSYGAHILEIAVLIPSSKSVLKSISENFSPCCPISHHSFASASACKFIWVFFCFFSPLAIISWHRCEHILAMPHLRVHYSAEMVKAALKLRSLKNQWLDRWKTSFPEIQAGIPKLPVFHPEPMFHSHY